jgi:hypothetical protein
MLGCVSDLLRYLREVLYRKAARYNFTHFWNTTSMLMGNHLDPVDSYLYVFRLARPSKDFEVKKSVIAISFEAFEMSSADKAGTPPHLSIWVEGCTTPLEAYAFLKPDSPNKIICWLNVGDIRSICIEIDKVIHRNLLDVIWVNISDLRAGAQGHSGIMGLDQNLKLLRKDLRFKLAELANKNAGDRSRIHTI